METFLSKHGFILNSVPTYYLSNKIQFSFVIISRIKYLNIFPGLTLWCTSWFVFKDVVLPGGFLFNMTGVVIAGYSVGHTLERYTTINPVVGMTLIGALYRNFGPPNFLENPVADVIDFHLRYIPIYLRENLVVITSIIIFLRVEHLYNFYH